MLNNNLLQKIDFFYKAAFLKVSYIKKLPNGKYRVLSEKGKNLGTYTSRKDAEKRLRQVEMFKHLKKKASKKIDLRDIEEFSYSSIMRKLVKNNKDVVLHFQKIFKNFFDEEYLKESKDPYNVSLVKTLIKVNKQIPVILSKEMAKNL